MKNYRFLFPYLARHKISYALGVVFIFLTNWLAVTIPYHIQVAIDLLTDHLEENQDFLIENIAIVIILAVLMSGVRTLSRVLFFNPGRAIERLLKNEIFSKLNHLQKDFHDHHATGTLISIANNDINSVRRMVGMGVLQVFNIFFALSLTPLKMWEISPSLTLYCAIPVIVTFLIAYRSVHYLRLLVRKRMVDLQSLSARVVGFLSGIDVIKGHQIQGWALREIEKESRELLERSLQISKIRSFLMPILGYTEQILKVIILSVGGVYLLKQELSIGEVTAFLAYATLLSLPFVLMGRIISIFQTGIVGLKSIRRILDQNTPPQDFIHLEIPKREALFQKGIVVKNLSFRYPDSTEMVLKNISFTIRPGQKIGILGKIGSGKSTLVNCLNHYLELEKGQILIDDHDVTELSRKDLRSAIRTLTQDPFLFSDTVVQNIKFGSAHLEKHALVEEVLFQSHLAEEVKMFPARQETLVGEQGILLSGGQKQRLSLARAMYTPCKLLILDNVLSAVDYETERFLLQQIFEKMQAQSILIVSHRVSVLEQVDQILILDQGEITERGSHEELLTRSKYYRSTWDLQQKRGEVA
ncbi:MAG: ABC transporter ATP-binding protein [SAR324 cluster bacterium]|nr:ABC transporter ATP-binding protein [SAR324 cluster bacterium]